MLEDMTRQEVEELRDKFWRNVKLSSDPDGCLTWSGSVTSQGYGIVYVNSLAYKAHRVSFEMHTGEIPESFLVHHNCRQKDCVNPEHLRSLSSADHARLHMDEEGYFKGKGKGKVKGCKGNRVRGEFCRSGLHKMEGHNLKPCRAKGRPSVRCRACSVAARGLRKLNDPEGFKAHDKARNAKYWKAKCERIKKEKSHA